MVVRKAKRRAPASRAFRDPWQSKGAQKRKRQRRQALTYPLGVIAEAMPQIVWTADPDGYQDYFNKMWFTYTGLTKHETYTGKKTAIHPEDFPRYLRQWKQALRTGKPYREAYRFLRAADKQYRWHIVSGSALRDEHGRIIKWIGTFTDVHDESERERTVRETNERLSLAQEASRMGFWEWNIAHDALIWSREFRQLFGFPRSAPATFATWRARVHPGDRTAAMETLQNAMRRRKRLEADYRIVLPRGGMRWIRATGKTFFSKEGKPLRMLGACIDITEIKHAEEVLRVSEEKLKGMNEELERNVAERTRQLLLLQEQDRANLQRLRDIVENMGMAAMASDERHVILFVNKHFCDLFGYPSPDALVGRDGRSELQRIQSLFDDPKATVGLLLRNWNEGTTSMGQEVRFKDGRIFARDYILVHSEGKHRGQLVLYRDVTKERRIDAAKSDFMSFASHQLRTPLTAVRWAVGRMKRSLPPGSEAERLAETARLAAQSMADTINTMLSVSRIEAGTVTLTPETFRVTDLFQEAVDVLHEEWHSRGQTIEVHCRQISIRTDQKLLREILTNLLTNAIKYSPTGSPIVLSARRQGEHVRIDVRDKGLGIPEGEQAKVFQKFYRGTNAAQMLADGSGLGLYLVSLLVRTLGGTISFTSREGEGTTFTVLLPGRRG